MRLKLYVSNKKVASRGKSKSFIFTVVDLDKAKTYPENFVCLLPQLNPNINSSNVFKATFGTESFQIAKTLLTKALRSEEDPNVKAEIQKRLKDLKIKPIPNTNKDNT